MPIDKYTIRFAECNSADAFIAHLEAYCPELEVAVVLSQDSKTYEWVIELFGTPQLDQRLIENQLKIFLKQSTNVSSYTNFEQLQDQDWLAENRKSFPPIKIGRFFIQSIENDNRKPPSGAIFMKISAALAFGSGTHATTSLCLEAMIELSKKSFNPLRMVDVGCGTAILAMAGQNLWKHTFKSNVAIDNDKKSVVQSVNNIIKNKLKNKINVLNASYIPSFNNKKLYNIDLITANILANPLKKFAPIAAQKMMQDGYIILSGITEKQINPVRAAYRNIGFIHCKTMKKSGWAMILMKKVS